jgi:hypothetical protein
MSSWKVEEAVTDMSFKCSMDVDHSKVKATFAKGPGPEFYRIKVEAFAFAAGDPQSVNDQKLRFFRKLLNSLQEAAHLVEDQIKSLE